jgi:hypothetical protein
MKTLKRLLFFLVGICLLMACSKSEQPGSDLLGWSNDNQKGHGIGCGEVFVVKPSTNDDTGPLKQAFEDAKLAGPGSVVKLVEGNYDLGFMEIDEFYGSFIGAGKGKTVISVKTGLDCDAKEPKGNNDFLINFVGGNVYVSDMTLKLTDVTICTNGNGLTGLLIFSDFNSFHTSDDNYINATVNNVEFIGYQFGAWWYNCWNALAGGANTTNTTTGTRSRSHVDLKVTNCNFDAFGFATQFWGIKEGKYILGTKNNGNVFTNNWEDAVVYECINDVKISVVGNRFNIPLNDPILGLWNEGLEINNYPQGGFIEESLTKPVFCTIEENEFNDAGGDCAIFLHDHEYALHPQDNIAMRVSIKNNRINMSDEATAGILMLEVQNSESLNNKFSGTGYYGMYAYAYWEGIITKNGLILGNDFSHATFSEAAIYLDYTTKNWKVIGNANATVIDLGVDNIIKNANFSHRHDHSGKDKQIMEDHINFNQGKFREHHHN